MTGRLACAALACAALALAVATGCGASSTRPQRAAAKPAAARGGPTPGPPPPVHLQLALPQIGLSNAPTVSYATTTGHSGVRGVVTPAGATIYMRGPDGSRTAVNPGTDGSFEVVASLQPGTNSFHFTAARLGSVSAAARLAITWRGRAAAARVRAIQADPAKYLAPASAGLNHKLPAVAKLPPVTAPAHRVRVTFTLNTIKAPAPPAVGGDGRWLDGFELTEYYPALESWFVGRPVATPGLTASHRIDWLYSARGLSMEGDGIGLDGKPYHIASLGAGGWLTAGGGSGAQFGVGANAPFWRTGGFWRSGSGALTFPLATGSWSAGVGTRYVPPPAGISFAPGPSRPLSYLRSVAVDPRLIAFGSHIYIPAYAGVNGGWFQADDTGGAIIGRHLDIFRPPPSNPADQGNFTTGQQVYVIPPGRPLP
ncbi:MAG: 3D domain-containing protein [Solirubrobacteraceae bacterium]